MFYFSNIHIVGLEDGISILLPVEFTYIHLALNSKDKAVVHHKYSDAVDGYLFDAFQRNNSVSPKT